MKKLVGGLKRAVSSSHSSRGSGLHSGDSGSQGSSRTLSYVPSPHGTVGPSRYPALDDVQMAIDGDNISIRSTAELEKYESLRHREFVHTRVYDVNLLERVGLDIELPTILRIVGWGKLFDEPHQAMKGMERSQMNLSAAVILLLLVLAAAEMDYPQRASLCQKLSGTFKGYCFPTANCVKACLKEDPNNVEGRCEGFFPSKCYCIFICSDP